MIKSTTSYSSVVTAAPQRPEPQEKQSLGQQQQHYQRLPQPQQIFQPPQPFKPLQQFQPPQKFHLLRPTLPLEISLQAFQKQTILQPRTIYQLQQTRPRDLKQHKYIPKSKKKKNNKYNFDYCKHKN